MGAMPTKPYPSDLADRFQVRMPAGLRDRIASAAAKNNRSMNAEIVSRLEGSFPALGAKPVRGRVPTQAEIDAAIDVLNSMRYFAHEIVVDGDVDRDPTPEEEAMAAAFVERDKKRRKS